jgi:putative folate metabolism gamma-glutamate ligase
METPLVHWRVKWVEKEGGKNKMKTTAIKTNPIILGDNLFKILDAKIPLLSDGAVIAIASKIISICEKRVVKIGTKDKELLVEEEADLYLPVVNKYNFHLSIKNNVIIPSAGIDESNGNGYYILWPKNPQASANNIRKYLLDKFKLRNLGVIIVDSKTTPLRWGVTGTAIAYSGFNPLNSYIGAKDIFGRKFEVEKVNIADALAVSAVVVMGEGSERTPIAIIEDIPFVKFQKKNPDKKELKKWSISLKDDLYRQMLTSVKWKKGKK